jgi:hypothetical protein
MNDGQSKTGSLVESLANIAIGVVLAFVSQLVIFGGYGVHVSLAQNAEMTVWFTAISLARSFVLRRVFNKITTRHPQRDQFLEYARYRLGAKSNLEAFERLNALLPKRCERWNNVAPDGRCR